MSVKKWVAGIIVVFLSVGMFCCQAWLMSKEGFDEIRAMEEDYGWCIYQQERIPRREADALIVADGVLYLHYEDYGYVNAYSTDGAFLWAYQVATGRNGIGGIGYTDGTLYIDGQCSGIYLFRGEELLKFERQSTKNPNWSAVNRIVDESEPVTDNGYTYYYNAEAGQINRAKPGEALETVVQLPVKDSNVETLIFANIALWPLFCLWLRIEDGEVPFLTEIMQERRKRLR